MPRTPPSHRLPSAHCEAASNASSSSRAPCCVSCGLSSWCSGSSSGPATRSRWWSPPRVSGCVRKTPGPQVTARPGRVHLLRAASEAAVPDAGRPTDGSRSCVPAFRQNFASLSDVFVSGSTRVHDLPGRLRPARQGGAAAYRSSATLDRMHLHAQASVCAQHRRVPIGQALSTAMTWRQILLAVAAVTVIATMCAGVQSGNDSPR
jgi:hypothetical protein